MGHYEQVRKLLVLKRVYEIRQDLTAKLCRSYREKSGLSLRECAKKMDISAAYLSDLERGRRKWNVKIVEKLVTACKSHNKLTGCTE